MANYTRNDLSGILAPVNAELEKVEAAIAAQLDREAPEGEPNQMSGDLDMNNNSLLNLRSPINPTDPVRLQDINNLIAPDSPVISVNGKVGVVAINKTDVGLGNVDNTADLLKPVSTPQQTALDGKLDALETIPTGNLISGFDANTVQDSTIVASTVVTKTSTPTENEVLTSAADGSLKESGVLISEVARKVTSPTVNAITTQTADGSIQDSGVLLSSLATATQGGKADTALQPSDNISELTNDSGFITTIAAYGINDLSDVNTTGKSTGRILEFDAGGSLIVGDKTAGAATSFAGLSDTPASYDGQAGKIATVNPAETALEFTSVIGAGLVDSVFGRVGTVSAITGDYTSDQITNSSLISGASVSDALESINSSIPVITGKMDKVPIPVLDNFIAMDGSGNAKDAGYSIDDLATSTQGALADTAIQPADVGTASASDLQTTAYDETVGSVLTVGAFGLGSNTPEQIVDLDTSIITETTSLGPWTTTGQPNVDHPDMNAAGIVQTLGRSTNGASQLAFTTSEDVAFRYRKDGVYGTWKEFYHSGNSVNPLDYGLGGFSTAATVDADTIFNGYHSISCSSDSANIPVAVAGTLLVQPWSTNSNAVQIYSTVTTSARMFLRFRSASVWQDWAEVQTSENEPDFYRTTTDLISGDLSSFAVGDVIPSYGFSTAGEHSVALWVKTATTTTVSQTPLQLGLPAFSDASGTRWDYQPNGVVNIAHLGATDDGTDQTATINVATDLFRDLLTSTPNSATNVILDGCGKTYTVEGSVDLTKLISSWNYKIQNLAIIGKCTGKAVLDFVGSRGGDMENVLVYGDVTNVPACGIQFARATNANYGFCDNWSLRNVTTIGYYSVAGAHFRAQETTHYDHCRFWNYNKNAHAAIHTGTNNFTMTSDYEPILEASASYINNKYTNVDYRNLPANRTASVTAISKASSAVVSVSTTTGFTVGQNAVIRFGTGMGEIEDTAYEVLAIGAGTITLDVDSTTFSTYTSGATVVACQNVSTVYLGRCEQHIFDACYIVSYGVPQLDFGFPDGVTPEQIELDVLFEGAGMLSHVRFIENTGDREVVGLNLKTYNTHTGLAIFSALESHNITLKACDLAVNSFTIADPQMFASPTRFACENVSMTLPDASLTIVDDLVSYSGDVKDLTTGLTTQYKVNIASFSTTGTWVPVVTAETGAITSYTLSQASCTEVGNLCFVRLVITITDAGTGANALNVTLPSTAVNAQVLAGRETLGGDALQGLIGASNSMDIRKYDNTTAIVTGSAVIMTGVYQVA